jgi:hypothetical protein
MSSDLDWFKSCYSGDRAAKCIEVAPVLKVTPTTWTAFITTLASLA